MKLTSGISRHNYYSFLWHASFLALAQNFRDIDTVYPATLMEAEGNGFHIGLMTAIMLGGWIIERSGYQLFFVLFVCIIMLSLFFIYKLNCRK